MSDHKQRKFSYSNEANPSDGYYRVFYGEFNDLDPKEIYNYQFSVEGEPLNLEGSLKEDDRYFKSSSVLQETD